MSGEWTNNMNEGLNLLDLEGLGPTSNFLYDK